MKIYRTHFEVFDSLDWDYREVSMLFSDVTTMEGTITEKLKNGKFGQIDPYLTRNGSDEEDSIKEIIKQARENIEEIELPYFS
jgi:hypothetical protein